MAYYRDHPNNAGSMSDLGHHYDEGPSQPMQQTGYSQNPFDSTNNIPLQVPSVAHDGPMYSQAANYSMADVTTRSPYQPSGWLRNSQTNKKRSRLIVLGSLAALVLVIVIGVVIGVVVSKNNKSSNSGGSNSNSTSVVKQTNPNDPSSFEKDSNLHDSFYGIAYTPEGSQLPDCGNNLTSVITDIQLLSQLTTRLRLYGADCNQSAVVLEAIKQTKVNMTVWLGNYVIATDNGASYQRQRDEIKAAIQTYGTDHIGGITVGNEFMLNYLTTNGGGDSPNSAIGNTGAAMLIGFIQDTRSMLQSMGVNIPVGNADAGSFFNTQVLQSVDYGMANVHPWFANVSVTDAAGWTASFFQTNNVQPAAALSNNPQMYIAETGWPTNSSDAGNESNGPGFATEPQLQTFLDTFVCQANVNKTEYFFFEYLDEPWKDVEFGGVEGWWGLFYSNRTLKNIKIPNCSFS